jgi:hypothetical protein
VSCNTAHVMQCLKGVKGAGLYSLTSCQLLELYLHIHRRKMHFVSRTASCATRRSSFLIKTSPVVPPAGSLSRGNLKQLCIRLSSTAGHKSTAKNQIKNDGANTPPKSQFSSIRPLPTPPPRQKGTPLTISTDDIEQYVQPLYARGWGFSRILPNGNGIAVLRKQFEFANAKALKRFLANLRKYEETMQVRFFHSFRSTFTFTLYRLRELPINVLKNLFFQHHAKTNVFRDQHAILVRTWTHVARRRSADADADADAKAEDNKGEKINGVTARDIRLAYALEGFFESVLAAGGEEYVPLVRPEADRPKTVEELNDYT